MTELLNNFPTSPSATEEPFRLESKLPKLDGYICLDCHGKAVSFTPPNFDSTTGPYLKCENCGFFAEFYKFQHRDASISPLGSVNPYDLLKPKSFKVIRTRRTVPNKRARSTANNRSYNRNQQFTPTEEPIPLLAGKPDTDLESMLKGRPGIITALVDSDYTQDRYSD